MPIYSEEDVSASKQPNLLQSAMDMGGQDDSDEEEEEETLKDLGKNIVVN